MVVVAAVPIVLVLAVVLKGLTLDFMLLITVNSVTVLAGAGQAAARE